MVDIANIPKIMAGFERMEPSMAHGAIVSPLQGAHEYVSQKGFWLIIMQALVDHKGRFMNASIDVPAGCVIPGCSGSL